MTLLGRILATILHAILETLLLPLTLLGWQPKPTAASVAAAALDAVRHDEPGEPLAPLVREPCPLAELVQRHAKAKLFTHEQHLLVDPLPRSLAAWIAGLDAGQLGEVIGCPAPRLQRHINAGLGGSTALGPFRLPPVVADAVPAGITGKGARGGADGPARPADISQILAEFGTTPAYSYGPRR
ncbi:hypothetical protein [Methylorubrum extorquens]|uniref:Uncharacterized protein n=1 Tax=Methylorubrum extorquens (strain ATCC 14718 / DSM 1338 / JCM 2805 / NCIMB 9133 / AM1) TaxID=272630 RepID=C5B076_METEA|nr:hypothetical protein [Methylorubrum extorquens]ACS39426.1 Hypothetical protein MexAM1_META1p1564 [Methylorubrum extorquens AM1]MCP1542468.1 hypothetical protein [Methylorubrum extorquens]MCP1590187.1 hypothetical protein [Methylorubrum extorquens]